MRQPGQRVLLGVAAVLAVVGVLGVPEAFILAVGVLVVVAQLRRRQRQKAPRPVVTYRPQPLQRWDVRT